MNIHWHGSSCPIIPQGFAVPRDHKFIAAVQIVSLALAVSVFAVAIGVFVFVLKYGAIYG